MRATRDNTLAAVLVGGGSRRMGVPKATLVLPWGQTLLEHTLAMAAHWAAEIVVAGELPAGAPSPPVPVWPDDRPGEGPLAALAGILRRSAHPWVLALACDVPRLCGDALRSLQEATDGPHDVVMARGRQDDRPNPLVAYYRRELADAMSDAVADGRRRLVRYLDACAVRVVTVEAPDSLASINTVEDWQALLAEHRAGESQKKEAP